MNKKTMALPKPLRQFYRTLHTNLPHLTKPQAITLALWSFASIHTATCGLTTVATYAARLRRQPQNTLRQRLREFYKDAAHKAGAQQGSSEADCSDLRLVCNRSVHAPYHQDS